jgi:diguanylate cyclase (GGDEF)-like protein
MSAFKGAESLAGQLRLASHSPKNSPPIVHHDTPLGKLAGNLNDNSHLFITDDTQRIIGVVSTDEVRRRLHATNEREQLRWRELPVSYLVKMTFSAEASANPTKYASETSCAAVFDDGVLLSIVAENELFINWRCLAGPISGATTDPLTGLINRLGYERRLHEEWERAYRMDFSIGVIMIDLDHFKEVNDQHGHDVGDGLLKRVASDLEKSLRSYDVLARYGGDEFIALCVGCRHGEIQIPISRILQNLNDRGADADSGPRVSASVGAAVRHDGFNASEPSDLFSMADQCLYLAKESRGTACWMELGSQYDAKPQTFSSLPTSSGALETAAIEAIAYQ